MAFTQQNLDNLERSIAEGTLEVDYGDKRVKYRSLIEMLRIRDLMRNELGITAPRVRKFAQFNSGLYPDTE